MSVWQIQGTDPISLLVSIDQDASVLEEHSYPATRHWVPVWKVLGHCTASLAVERARVTTAEERLTC